VSATQGEQKRAGGAPAATDRPAPPWRPPPLDGLVPVPTFRDQPATPASDISGLDLDGQPVDVALLGSGRWTLLVFLSAGCHGCLPIWEALGDPVASGLATDELVVAVTRDASVDDPAALRGVSVPGVPVVMSSAAWQAYRVQGPPFFVLVGPDAAPGSRVATEGVAWGVAQIADDVRRARQRA